MLRLQSGKAAPGQVDVAWMLGSGSKVDDWELRMSLRSFAANYRASAQLWVIGRIPSWLDRSLVRCIEWPDPHRTNKDANLLGKALRLAMEPDLSDLFILCSDDHFLLRESRPDEFGWWHGGEIRDVSDTATTWQKRVVATRDKLRAAGLPSQHFDQHIPYALRKQWCPEALRFDYASGMTLFSTLLNAARITGQPIESERVRGDIRGKEVSAKTLDWKTKVNQFACLDGASVGNRLVVERIEALFPARAPWEKTPHAIPWTFDDGSTLEPSAATRSNPLPITSAVPLPAGAQKIVALLARNLPPGQKMPYRSAQGAWEIKRTKDGLSVTTWEQVAETAVPRWGPSLWREIHAAARTLRNEDERRAFIGHIHLRIPCEDCRTHWRELLKAIPPVIESSAEFFAWTVAAHSVTSRRIGQPEMPLADAEKLYPC